MPYTLKYRRGSFAFEQQFPSAEAAARFASTLLQEGATHFAVEQQGALVMSDSELRSSWFARPEV